MLSNRVLSTMENLSSESCNEIAEFLDAQADYMRVIATQKNDQIRHEKEALKRAAEKQKKLLTAGSEALKLVERNVEKVAACSRIATVFSLDVIHVEANFKIAKREKATRLRKERNKKALHLNSKGLSLRQIALELSVSKSTIQTLLKRGRAEAAPPA